MNKRPEVCVLPVAGLSTRNLPTTKVLHKGFMTLDNIPVIQYAVNACAEAGFKEIVFIYSDEACKRMFGNYYTPAPQLEDKLSKQNKKELLAAVQSIIPAGMTFSFARQDEPKGNGHAILMAKDIIGKRDFAVMWVDDVYLNKGGKGIMQQLCEVDEQKGGIVENIMECKREDMVRYGALIGAEREGNIVKARGLVEKPKLEEVPSNYASMGPYIIPNEVMDIMPGGYLWGSALMFYSDLPRLFETVRAGDLSGRALERILGTHLVIPPDRLIQPTLGMVLPQSFVDADVFYKVFPTAREYLIKLVKDYEAYTRIATQVGEEVEFSMEEALDIVRQELNRANLSLDRMDSDSRCSFAVQMNRKYQLKAKHLSLALLVPERVLAQKLYAARTRAKR